MPRDKIFRNDYNIKKLLDVQISDKAWIHSMVAMEENTQISSLPPDLYVQFANLPHDIFQSGRADSRAFDAAERAYRDFLGRWGLFRDTDFLAKPGITGGDKESQSAVNRIPPHLYVPAANALKGGHGFFAVSVKQFWLELCQFKALVNSWVGIRTGNAAVLLRAFQLRGWSEVGPRIIAKRLEQGNEETQEPSFSELESDARQSLKALKKVFSPELRFAGGTSALVLTYSSLLPAVRAQLLLSSLRNENLIACKMCGKTRLAKRATAIYCDRCGRRAAQASYARTAKGKKTKQRYEQTLIQGAE